MGEVCVGLAGTLVLLLPLGAQSIGIGFIVVVVVVVLVLVLVLVVVVAGFATALIRLMRGTDAGAAAGRLSELNLSGAAA
jgi:hypothetical protein